MTDLQSSLQLSRRSSDLRTLLHGLWLPLVTPFRDGALDETSLRRLARHYAALPVNGLILAATTGESLTLSPEETERLVRTVRDETGPRDLPICLGLSGSDTRALLQTLERTAAWPIDFYLISCPYYSRPSQRGLALHFTALAERAMLHLARDRGLVFDDAPRRYSSPISTSAPGAGACTWSGGLARWSAATAGPSFHRAVRLTRLTDSARSAVSCLVSSLTVDRRPGCPRRWPSPSTGCWAAMPSGGKGGLVQP